jgi:hypothetical protein
LFLHIEPDSDPEFNPGTFVYEPKKRSKRKSKAGGESSPSSPRKRRSDVLGNLESISRSRELVYFTHKVVVTPEDNFRETPTNGPGRG